MSYQKSVALLCCAFLFSALVPECLKASTSEAPNWEAHEVAERSFEAELKSASLLTPSTALPPDEDGPVITITPPDDVVLYGCHADLTFSEGAMGKPNFTVYDECGSATVVQMSSDSYAYCAQADDASPEGGLVITRTFTIVAEDCYGNTTTEIVVQTITVVDNNLPSFVEDLPGDITVDCAAIPTAPVLTATDTCDSDVNVEYTELATNDCSGITRTWVATDDCGNSVTHTQNITVTDTEDPVILGTPGDISQSNDPSACGALITWTLATATDNCALYSLVSDHNSGDAFPVGITTVTYTATDNCGNSSTTSFDVTVTDEEDPSIAGTPLDITQTNDAGNCSAAVTWTAPTGSDNCSQTLTSTHDSGDTFVVGTTTVTYTSTDGAGNSVTSSFDVTVTDDEDPSIAGTPLDITQTNDAGNCSAAVTWTAPTGSDNCSQTLTSTHDSGDTFVVGTTTVTYTSTDGAGNSVTSSFDVTVTDDEDPSIAGTPLDITQTNDAGNCSAAVTWTAPTGSDNCSQTLTSTHNSGDTFVVGTTTVTYTSTDGAGNSVTSSFDVTVTDDEDPAIAGTPLDITQTNDAGNCSAVVTWTAPTGSDNCSQTLTSTHNSGDTFVVGTTTVTYTSTDGAGNSVTSSFDVTVTDDEDPAIAGTPLDITQTNDAGNCSAAVTWTAPTGSDNCSQTLTSTHNSGDTFVVGTTTVTYTSTDGAGNSVTSSFDVTVTDDEDPAIAGTPLDITQTNDAGNCSAVVTWTAPTGSDNCSQTLTSTHNSGDTFALGTTTVTYTSTDGAGNSVTSSFDVTVTDDEDPSIAGTPLDITQTNDAGNCSAVVTWTAPTGSDNCSQTLTSTHNSGDTFVVGTTTVTYTSTDGAGNSVTSSFDVTVTDGEDPAIAGTPLDITQTNDAGNCSAVVTWTAPTISDNCPGETLTSTHNSGDTFVVGTTTVTYTSTDGAGNSVTSSFDVTVTDDEDPAIAGTPLDITQTNDAGNCSAVVTWTAPTGSDNCSQTLTSTHDSGDTFVVGTTTVTYTSTDGAGNSVTSSFDVTVTDDEDPSIAGTPLDITQTNDAGNCSAAVTWTAPTGSDNCSQTLTSTHDSGDTFVVGTTTVTYTSTDGAGNSVTSSFDVTVTDDEDPSIAGTPLDITQTNDAGNCSAAVTWTAPTGSDNCSQTLTSTHNSGDTFVVGTTTVTYTSTDGAGNSVTSSFDVTVTDDEDPAIAGTPLDITQTNDAGNCSAVVTWTAPTGSDNCSQTLTSTHNSGDTFVVGTTTVTYTSTDGAGNSVTSSFDVTVTDGEDPAIAGTPLDITQTNDAGNCSAAVTWTAPTGSDNCSQTLTSTHNSGDTFVVGTTTVTYTSTDGAGNSVTSSFDVTVTDDEDPVIQGAPMGITQSTDAGVCEAAVSWPAITAEDNCDIASLSSLHNSGDTFPLGTTTVTYSALDIHGNTSSISFDVLVEDTESPTITIQAAHEDVECDGEGNTAALVAWLNANGGASATDNCSAVTWSNDFNTMANTCGSTGAVTVVFTAKDEALNASSTVATFTINDTQAPTITNVASNSTVECDGNGNQTEFTSWLDSNGGATADEVCSSVTWSHNYLGLDIEGQINDFSNGCGLSGFVTVVFTASDDCGQESETSATFTIADTEDPNAIGQNYTVLLDDGGDGSLVASELDGGSSDDCSTNLSFSASATEFDCNDTGDNLVVLTVTDQCGNDADVDVTVTVKDEVDPVIDDEAEDMTVECDGTDYSGALNSWLVNRGGAMASDACGPLTWTQSPDPAVLIATCGDASAVTVTWTATDANGNSASTAATFTIEDTTPPTIQSDATDVTVECDGNGNTESLASWVEANGGAGIATDLCGDVTWTNNFHGLAATCAGTAAVEVTFYATDGCGNSASTTAIFTIEDTTAPTLTASAQDSTAECDGSGNTEDLEAWLNNHGGATAEELCGQVTWSHNHSNLSDECAATGSTTVNFTASDNCGNTVTTQATFNVIDNASPIALGADFTAILNENGQAVITADDIDDGSYDACGDISMSLDVTHFDCDDVGSNPVTLTVTDECMNAASATVMVTVTALDNSDPTVSNVPDDITQPADVDMCSAVVTFTLPSFADNCADAPSDITMTSTHNSGDAFPLGITTVTITGEDPSGNTVSSSFDITVTDNQDPSIAGTPLDITQTNDAGNCSAVVTWTAPTGSDNCSQTLTSTHNSGDTFVVGTTTVTYTSTDGAGNSVTSSFDVTVTDDEDPAIAGTPLDITQTNDAGNCSAVVTWTAPTGSDNCSQTLTSTHNSGDTFVVGTTTVTYTSTDGAGNSVTSSFDVTVTDGEDPAIAGTPLDITQTNDAGNCSAVVTWTAPTGSDNCSQTLTSTHNSGDTFVVGTTTVTYTSTDGAGNSVTSSFDVTVTDDEDPAIAGTPLDITQTNDAGNCSAAVTWTAPTGSDNCSQTLTSTHNSGDTFALGTTTVTYTSTDGAGNSVTSSFDVTVTDDEDPAIAGTPLDITQTNDAGNCSAVVTWTAPTSSDNCPGETLTSTHNSGDTFAVGTTTVTYTATDGASNSVTSSFDVTVNDGENPVITAAADTTVECDGAGNTVALNAWLANHGGATATDNCAEVSISNDYGTVVSTDDCGMTTTSLVTFTATDAAGNTSTTTASFIIEDTTPPTFDPYGSSEVVECDGNGNSDQLTAWLEIWNAGITVTDNCGGVSVSKTVALLTDECGATGEASVTFEATDDCGNKNDTTLTFTIEDTTPPTLNDLAQDMTVECDGLGNQAAFDAWLASHGGATAEDVCGDYTWSNNFVTLSDDCGATGSSTVTFSATDDCGNTSTTTATFTIEDTTDPAISSEAQDLTVECDGAGNLDDLNGWLSANGNAGAASDVCGTFNWSNDFESLSDDCGYTGSAVVTFTVTDECNNTSTTSATFTIEDTTAPDAPALTCPNDTVLYSDASCFVDTTTTGIGYATATAYDTCDSLPTINISYADSEAIYTCTSNPDNAAEGSYGFIRTWTSTVTDECQLTSAVSTCIQTITVLDTMSPVLVASMDTTVECDGAGNPADLAAWLANNGGATATDNCDSELAWDNDYDPSNFVDLCGATGHVVVTFTVTDDCGNSSSSTSTFTIEDTTPPAFSATAEDLIVECDGAGNTTELNNWLAANANAAASDICGGVTWTNDFIDLTDECGATGRRTVTFTATDDCGNYVYTSSTFTIEDTTDPAIASEAQDLTVECDGTGNTIELNGWLNSNGGAGAAADACGDVTWSNDFVALSDDCGATGSATVIFTATDDCGLSASTTATFTIEDKTDPAIASEAQNLTVECDGAGNAAELNNWLDANGNAGTASDACGDVVWSHDFVALSDDCGATGAATVIFTATDECGNTSTTSAIFTIEDTVDPAIASEAQDLTVECDGAGNPTDLANWLNANGNAGTASDACGDVVWSNDFTALSDDCGATGAATVTFTATDECGNTSTTSATFTIEDTTDPILSGDEVVIIDCAQWPWEALYQPTIDELLTVVDTAGNPMITLDESCGYTNFPIDFGVMSGGCSYDHQLIYYPVDACGNTGDSLYQVIQVDDFSDPVFTHVPADTMIACTENVMVYLEMATAIDACDPSVNMTFQDEVIPTACPEEFTIRRTFYAEDCGYNIAEAVQTITVADTAAPSLSITAPSDTVFYGCLSSPDLSLEATGTVTWIESDDCGEVTVTFTTTDVSTYTCTADDAVEEGSHLVTRTFTVTAVDCAGNSTIKTVDQVITITDNEVPMATLTAPADTTIYLDETCFASDVAHPVSGDATGFLVDATDNCDSEVAHTIVHEDDTTYTGVADGVGSFDILRTYTVTLVDDCGNDTTETTSHMIHVMDTIHPATYTDFPNDTIIYADDSNGYFDPTPSSTGGPLVNYSDNCSGSGDSQYGVFGQSASTGGLIITAIADPNSGASCRFVEIHNSSDAGINLSGYALQRWTNGSSTPSTSNNIDLSPIGTLEPGVYAHIARSADFSDCYGFAPDMVGSGGGPVDSNGDDQVAIIDGSANIVDIFGVIGEAGDNNCHDFEDGMALRAGSNTDPNAGTWDESGWIVYSDYSTASGCTNHNANQPQGPADIAPFVSNWAGAAPPAEETDFNSTDMSFADVTTSYTASACYTFERTWTVTVTDNNGNATTTSSVQTIAVSDTTAPVITADAETTAACDLFGFDLSAGDESTLLAGTSFEQASTGSQYTDTGDAGEDHALINNPGQADVNFTAANGEMGFTSYFYTTGSGGLSNDFTGVSSFTGQVDAYTDGAQGFQMTDVDGRMELTFDEVDVSDGGVTLSIDAFIQSTGWETADLVRIWIVADGGEVDLLNTTGQDIDNLGIEDQWITYTLDLDGYDSAELHVSLASNSGSETLYIDNISFSQGNSPLAALMANGYVAFNDNVELASTAASITLDGSPCEGAYDIVYSATDSCGNASSMSQRIALLDTVNPVLTVIEPADTTIYADADCFADFIDGVPYPAASATDNCDSDVEITAYHADGPKQYSCLPGTGAFSLLRTYTTTATDNCGNEHTVQVNRLVTVLDTIKPTFNATAPAALFVNIDPFCGANTSTTIGGEPTVTDVDDNCDIDVDVTTTHVDSAPVYTCSDADGTAEGSYTFVRTFTVTATDDCGNATVKTVTQDVTATDVTSPVITAVPPMAAEVYNLDASCAVDLTPTASPTALASDACDTDVTITSSYVDGPSTYTCDDSDGAAEGSFSFTRTWTVTATDDCNNSSSQQTTQLVSVLDEVEPSLSPTWPADYTTDLDADCTADLSPSMAGSATATGEDACDTDVAIAISHADHDTTLLAVNVDAQAEGGYTFIRTWTATSTDDCGNATTQTHDQVITANDVMAPTQTLETLPTYMVEGCYGDVDLSPATTGTPSVMAEDACDTELDIDVTYTTDDLAFNEVVGNYSLVFDTISGPAEGIIGSTTVRMYIETANDGDVISAVAGDIVNPTGIRTTTSFYQNVLGGSTANNLSDLLLAADPLLAYDSWVTIGLEEAPNTADGEVETSTVGDWNAAFSAGEDLLINDFFGGSWFTVYPNSAAVAGADHRVLLGQFTTDGQMSGQLFIQVFPNGVGSDEQRISFTFGDCAEDDDTPEGSYSFTRRWESVVTDDANNQDTAVNYQHIMVLDTEAPQLTNTCGLENGEEVMYDCPGAGVLDFDPVPVACDVTAIDNCDSEVNVTLFTETEGYIPTDLIRNYCAPNTPEAQGGAQTCDDRAPEVLRLFNFPGLDDSFVMADGENLIQVMSDGSMNISIEVENADGTGGFIMSAAYGAGQDWTTWQAGGSNYKKDCAEIYPGEAVWEDWVYFLMTSGDLEGTGMYAGSSFTLTHQPANGYYGMQMGLGANNKNTNYGGSAWFFWQGNLFMDGVDMGPMASSGDVYMDLDCCLEWEVDYFYTALDDCGNPTGFSYSEGMGSGIGSADPGVSGGHTVGPVDITSAGGIKEPIRITGLAPNPTNTQSQLTFVVSQNMRLRVDLYTMDGLLVQELYQGNAVTGVQYMMDIDADDLAAGMYQVRVSSNIYLAVKKLLVAE